MKEGIAAVIGGEITFALFILEIKVVRVHGPPFKISDLSCEQVLLKMENLRVLDFSRVLCWKTEQSGSFVSF